jgi:acetoacetate decarboxylase
MFEFDPKGRYMMPAHFGTPKTDRAPSGWYHDVTSMIVSYVTDREKLAAYLPAPFEVAEEAVIKVIYACNKNVDWLAGRGYNLLGAEADVIFNGKEDQLPGSYTLALWENLTDAIISGRELQGIPKIFADIPDHSVIDEEWRCDASHFGNKIIDMKLTDVRAASAEEIAAAQEEQKGEDNPMHWRYMPNVGGFGAALSEPTISPLESVVKEAYVGEGRVDWNHVTWEQNPTQFHIVNALANLPILEYRPAIIMKGSTNLMLPTRWARTLR